MRVPGSPSRRAERAGAGAGRGAGPRLPGPGSPAERGRRLPSRFPGAPRAPSRAVTNLRLSASWRGAQARLPRPPPPAPSSGPRSGRLGGENRASRRRHRVPGRVGSGSGRAAPCRLSRSACFDPGRASACFLPRKHFDRRFLCAAEEPGRAGGFNPLRAAPRRAPWWGAAGGLADMAAISLVGQTGARRSPAGSEEPAQARRLSGGEQAARPGRLVNVQALPGAARNPAGQARRGEVRA